MEKQEDVIARNIRDNINKKMVAEKIQKENKEVFSLNIPKYMKKYNFSRRQIHKIFTLYKVLQLVTSQKYRVGEYQSKRGLDFRTFKKGVQEVMGQPDEIVRRQFQTIDINWSGFINWEEFLELMVQIQAKTVVNKIDLFFQVLMVY